MNNHSLHIVDACALCSSASLTRRGWIEALVLPLAATVGLAACGGSSDDDLNLSIDFTSALEPWQAGFADYTPGNADFDLASGVRAVPSLGIPGFFLGSTNRSDDMFMFIHRVVGGLRPNQRYRVAFSVNIATNAPTGCVGVGGSPGESVYVKAGATVKPIALVMDASGVLRLAGIDHGQQSTGGSDMAVLGDLANGSTDCSSATYRNKTLRGTLPLVSSDARGQLRLLFGTDSGFEGRTEVYWVSARVMFSFTS